MLQRHTGFANRAFLNLKWTKNVPVMQRPGLRPYSDNKQVKTDQYPDDQHATSKVKEGDTHNIQEKNAEHGMKYVFFSVEAERFLAPGD